jgi:NAD(P)H-quinone oxidoreductase subunit 5
MSYELLMTFLGVCVVAPPALLLAGLGMSSLFNVAPAEQTITRCTKIAVVTGLLAALAILALMLISGTRHIPIVVGDWVVIQHEHFHFTIKFVFDRLSVPFAILSFLLCGTVAAFAAAYLHREPGFNRFHVFYAMFLLGMIVASLAGTIETLFAGWELVGLSSALLVAFFQERSGPVHNGQRVWSVYRIADAALLIAAVALHHLTGEGDFSKLLGGPWPQGQALLTSQQALFVGLLLLVAAAGKSALIPFSGWLPRAMEGPTPSSAIFYGAMSVHLGAFLLLRFSAILELSPALRIVVVLLGLATAVYAAITARVQTDIKSALSFACLTQLGVIVVEIGLGLRYLALVHIIGHACLRTLQFVRAPTLLHDYHALENALGEHLPHGDSFGKRWSASVRQWVYRFALERGYFDAWLDGWVVHPVVRLFQHCDSLERRWTDFLSGGPSRESDQAPPSPTALEDLT